jgi:hypothetical protein
MRRPGGSGKPLAYAMARARIELATPRFSVVFLVFGAFRLLHLPPANPCFSCADAALGLWPFPGLVLPIRCPPCKPLLCMEGSRFLGLLRGLNETRQTPSSRVSEMPQKVLGPVVVRSFPEASSPFSRTQATTRVCPPISEPPACRLARYAGK